MNYDKWLKENTERLDGKRVAITGSTGGLGKELCRYLASLGADLILLDRNRSRSEANKADIEREFPNICVDMMTLDLQELESVKRAAESLKTANIDVFIHNAGAYSIPRHATDAGYENVFTINFLSPYYIIRELLPSLRERKGRVMVVGSIAHNYSRIDECDIDFSKRRQASKVYGNAKRYLMFSLFELFKNEDRVSLAITHPGITFTNITSHYPKLIFAIIKHPMKVIFMKPKKAALSLLKGVFQSTEYHTWIGPRIFDIWGLPSIKILRTCSINESRKIADIADGIYKSLSSATK